MVEVARNLSSGELRRLVPALGEHLPAILTEVRQEFQTEWPDYAEFLAHEQGEVTTGTMSPKAIEFHVNAEGEKVYNDWKNAAVKFDPEASKRMLDELGLKDKDGDGYREFPDGSKLSLRGDQQADTTQEQKSKNA